MDRRSLCLGAGIVPVTAALAAAQSSTAQPTAGSSAAAGEAERRHANASLAAGADALATSRVAVSKAGASARRFAQLEIAEQETLAAVLKQRGHEPAGALDAPGQSMVDRLKNTAAGADFDKAYIDHQLEGHKRLLEIQEAYLANGKDSYSTAVAMLARGHIREHISDLEVIQQELKG